jgi:hypothetical protein
MKEYRLAPASAGRRPLLALSRLIVRGILEDFPRVKWVRMAAAASASRPAHYAYELQDEAFFLGPMRP